MFIHCRKQVLILKHSQRVSAPHQETAVLLAALHQLRASTCIEGVDVLRRRRLHLAHLCVFLVRNKFELRWILLQLCKQLVRHL